MLGRDGMVMGMGMAATRGWECKRDVSAGPSPHCQHHTTTHAQWETIPCGGVPRFSMVVVVRGVWCVVHGAWCVLCTVWCVRVDGGSGGGVCTVVCAGGWW